MNPPLPLYPLLAALWSLAIPGFGQLYNGRYIKGILFIFLEFIINLNSHLNAAIYYSWRFQMQDAVKCLNFEWLLFYPCFYMFAIYDAYHDCCLLTKHTMPRWIGLPFILCWLSGTVGIIVSTQRTSIPLLYQLGPVLFGFLDIVLCLGCGCWLAYLHHRHQGHV